jgi:hypothetical protein
MQTYDDYAEMARLCAKNAWIAHSKEASAELWKMALEYQQKAAAIDSGKMPEIGNPPPWLE